MNVILLTIFVGFVLVGLFVTLFFMYRRDADTSSAERDSLFPLEEETWTPARKTGENPPVPGRPHASGGPPVE